MKVIAAAYQEGVGVKKNLEEAMKWLNKAKQYEKKQEIKKRAYRSEKQKAEILICIKIAAFF